MHALLINICSFKKNLRCIYYIKIFKHILLDNKILIIHFKVYNYIDV